jgi:hypothetical protein
MRRVCAARWPRSACKQLCFLSVHQEHACAQRRVLQHGRRGPVRLTRILFDDVCLVVETAEAAIRKVAETYQIADPETPEAPRSTPTGFMKRKSLPPELTSLLTDHPLLLLARELGQVTTSSTANLKHYGATTKINREASARRAYHLSNARIAVKTSDV